MTKAETTPDPKRYKSTQDAYVDGVYYRAGTPFVTSQPKGIDWKEISAKEKAATEAADPLKHDDVNLSKLKGDALKAHAASLGVDIGEATADADIRDLIRAAHDATR